MRDNGFKVVLTGEGADEVLGGYDIFKEAKIRRFWGRNLESKWRPLLLKRLYPYMQGIQRQPPEYLKHFFRVSAEDLASPFFSHLPRWELTAKLKSLFSARRARGTAGLRRSWRSRTGFARRLSSLAVIQPGASISRPSIFSPGYILSSQSDRMAMAHSVEGRFPFLDYRVVEFAAKLPARLKMKVLNQKYLLKKAFAGRDP